MCGKCVFSTPNTAEVEDGDTAFDGIKISVVSKSEKIVFHWGFGGAVSFCAKLKLCTHLAPGVSTHVGCRGDVSAGRHALWGTGLRRRAHGVRRGSRPAPQIRAPEGGETWQAGEEGGGAQRGS
jgi:hypothetical protein